MTGRALKFEFESTLELEPGFDTAVEVSGFVTVFTETYGEDADGRRGGVRTEVDEVILVAVYANFPGRHPILLSSNKAQTEDFLTPLEIDCFIDLACDTVFRNYSPDELEFDG